MICDLNNRLLMFFYKENLGGYKKILTTKLSRPDNYGYFTQ